MMDQEASRRRIEHLREWLAALHREAGAELCELDSEVFAAGAVMADPLGEIEVFFGDWSACVARVVNGRSIPKTDQLTSLLATSVFDLPGVPELFLRKGQFDRIKRYIEGVECLRHALLMHLAAVEATGCE